MRTALSLLLALIVVLSAHGAEMDRKALDALFAEGVYAYERQKDYDKALERMNTILEADPDCDGALYYRAKVYIRENKLDEATADIERALELKPDEQRYLYTKGRILENRGEAERALEWYSKALDQKFHSGSLRKRIRLYLSAGEYKKALGDCGWLHKHEPTPRTKMLRAEVYLKLGKTEAAYYDLVSASYLERYKVEPILALGDFFLFHELDLRQAIAYYTAAIEVDDFKEPKTVPFKERTERPIARLRRGQAYAALDAQLFGKKALEDFTRYIKINPDTPEKGYAERAKLYVNMGEHEKALADIRKAIELDPDNEEYAETLDAIIAARVEGGKNKETEPFDSQEELQ